MINKIKDFLRNLMKKKASKKHSDQSDEDDTGLGALPAAPEGTDQFTVTVANYSPKKNFKEKFTSSINFSKFKNFKMPGQSGEKPLLGQNLNRIIEKMMARSSREPIHQFFLVLLISGITYTLGKITALSLMTYQGHPKIESARSYSIDLQVEGKFNVATLGQVKAVNLFRTNVPGSKKPKADTKCEVAQQASNLPIKLLNTIVLQDSVKSLASVQVRGERVLQEVREGDQISNIAKIFKITRLELLIKNLENGICETVASDKARETLSPSNVGVMSPKASRDYKMNKKMSGIDNVGNKFSISKALLDEKLADINKVLTQARAIQIVNPDGTLSFKLTELDPTGIFPYLGVQDQDIITSINGKAIYSMNEVMQLFSRISNMNNLSLGIKREGTESVQEYSIKK